MKQKCKLTVGERSLQENGKLVFEIELDASDRALGLHRRTYRTLPMEADPIEHFRHLSKTLEGADNRRNIAVETHLADASLALFDALFPEDLRDKLCQTWPQIDAVHIISPTHLIPWELCRLKRLGEGNVETTDFLCAQHPITRWFPGQTHPADYLPAENLVVSAPRSSDLIYAREELAGLLDQQALFVDRKEIEARTDDIKQALQSGAWDIFHFMGHGQRDEDFPNRSRIFLDRNQYLTPENLADVRIDSQGMLVFLNACGTGARQISAKSLGSWAEAFVKAGAGAFVGSAWDVSEKPACRFAHAFYKVLADGACFGEALRLARLEIRNSGDATWLAYVGFGDAYASHHPPVQPSEAERPIQISGDDEEVLSPDFLDPTAQTLLAEFAKHLNGNRACVLLGDRLSPRSGLPDDPQLARLLAEKAGLSYRDAEMTFLQAEEQFGQARIRQWLAELLEDEDKPLSDVCQILARAPFKTYLTTQMDRLLEWGLKDAGRNGLPLFLPADRASLGQAGKDIILKLRGTVEHPHTLWPRRQPLFNPDMEKLARGCVAGRALLIVGFDVSDPAFPRLLERVAEWGVMPGACLVIAPGISKETRKRLATYHADTIDPGPEEDRLPLVLGCLAGMSRQRVHAFSERRLIRANPFPGLLPYRVGSRHFYGREERLKTFYEGLDDLPPITVFFGESGTGKTSFFYAGLTQFLAGKPVRFGVTRLPVNRRPADYLREFIDELANHNPDEERKNQKTIVVLDQFEQFFFSDMKKTETRRFLSHSLTEMASAADGRLFFILVMRSDELHHLHDYRDTPGLSGVYQDSERFETLGRQVAEKVVQRIFLTKDYALEEETVAALAETSCHNDRVYLPYLQLLGSRFFEYLEHKLGEQRGFDQVIRIPLANFRDFTRRGAHFSDFIHEVVLELNQLEPDRALILRIFDMLIDGSRRASIRAELLKEAFAEPERIDFMLYQMVSRRLVHYDEVDESYELVHDALVPFLNRYLDNQRIDYSRAELLVAARKMVEGKARYAVIENVALYCLRHDIPLIWIEHLALDHDKTPFFYLDLRRKLLPEDMAFWWICFAESCSRVGVVPSSLSSKEVIQLLFMTKSPAELILALSRLLTLMPLAPRDLAFLVRWIDPDSDPNGPLPPFPFQQRASEHAFGHVLDALFAAPGVDPLHFFRGERCLYFSESGWWTVYFQKLLRLTQDGLVPVEGMIKRAMESVSASEMDDHQLWALATALSEYKPVPEAWLPVVKGVLLFLQRRPGARWKRVSLDLFGEMLPMLPSFVFQRSTSLLVEFVKTDEIWRAVSLQSEAIQDKSDFLECCGRFLRQENPKIKGFLFHALLKANIEIDDIEQLVNSLGQAGHFPPDLQRVAGVAYLQHPPFLQEFGQCLVAGDWLNRCRAFLAKHLTNIRVFVPAIWLGRLESTKANVAQRFFLAGRCAVLTACLLVEGSDGLPAEIRSELPPIATDSDPASFIGWWDQAMPSVASLGMSLVNVGEVLQDRLRSMQRFLAASARHGKVSLLVRAMEQWFQQFPDLTHSLSGMDSPYACSPISGYPVFQTLTLLLEDPAVEEALQAWRCHNEDKPLHETGKTLAFFAVLEQARYLSHRTLLVDEILDRMVAWLTQEPVKGGELFLGAMLLRKNLQERPDIPREQCQQQILDALVLAYAGSEAILIANFSENDLDYATRIALLGTLEKVRPGSAAKNLLECAFSLSEEPLGHDLAIQALEALTSSDLPLPEPEAFKTWASGLTIPAIAKSALPLLLGMGQDGEARLVAVEKLLAFPELAPDFVAGIE